MKIVLIILILISGKTFGQDYVANWKTVGKEPEVVNYQVQSSRDSLVGYITLATIMPQKKPDSNWYSYTLPPVSNFYRIKALLLKGIAYTKPKKIVITNNTVIITNAVLKLTTSSDNLSFNAIGEATVSYYLIERSTGAGWEIVGKITAKVAGKYIVNVSKSINKKYRVTAYYKDGSKSQPLNFI